MLIRGPSLVTEEASDTTSVHCAANVTGEATRTDAAGAESSGTSGASVSRDVSQFRSQVEALREQAGENWLTAFNSLRGGVVAPVCGVSDSICQLSSCSSGGSLHSALDNK